MTLSATARPRRLSTGGALLRVLVTLLMFLVVFMAFLIAPILTLGLAFLAYLIWRSRGGKQKSGEPTPKSHPAAKGFGAGV